MREVSFGRRRIALLAGLLLPGCAGAPSTGRAQAPRPSARPAPAPAGRAAVLLPPLPCADRAGDLCALLLEGSGAPAGTVVVFGQAFRPGDLPPGAGLGARLAADGRALAAQLDVQRRHPDGSARFALVALAAPALPAGQRAGVVLSRAAPAEAAPLDLAAALAGRRAEVEITPREGAPWRADLVALLREARQAPRWQSGPLALQARLDVPVRLGAVTSLRLVADLAARADGSLWVDFWLRNDIAMQPGGGELAYGLRLALDGREALATTVPRHWQYAAWGRLLGGGRDGAAAAPPPRVIHDPTYLAATAAILPFDVSTGVTEAVLERMASMTEAPNWSEPLGARGIQTRMGAPGARPDLGQVTLWQAAWLVTGDARAAALSIGQAEAAGSVPWHFWDPRGGAEGRGGWLDVRRWPRFWADTRGGRPPLTLLQPVARNTIWAPGPVPSHQPNLSHVPYLLTGRRAFLDNLMAQAAWNVTSVWPSVRRAEGAPEQAQDLILLRNRQVRSSAWTMRQLDTAAWIAAEDEPTRAYVEEVAAVNWAWLRAQLPDWTRRQGEPHGYVMPLDVGYGPNLGPWQQDYFASSAALAALRGREDARAVLDWMRNFIVGRFFAADRGFSRHDAVAYRFALVAEPVPRGPAPPGRLLTSWAEIAEATRVRDLSNGEGWRYSNGEYARLGLLSLALVHQVFADPRALEAFEWLSASDAPYVGVNVFQRTPNHNVMPAGRVRVPDRAPRCTATSGG